MNPSGILCIGAFNHDTVVLSTVPQSVIRQVAEHSRYDAYGEMLVPDALAEGIIQNVRAGKFQYTQQLGGSAFNVARVLSVFTPQLRLGFWGVAGRVDQAWPHVEYLKNAGVETDVVVTSTSPAAASIAYSADADRTIFTSRGANDEASAQLQQRRDELVPYFASFEVIHITSFLDPTMPFVLAAAVQDALAINPSLIVSVDPGHAWSTQPTEAVERLLGTASLLHLNSLEFASLGGRVSNEPDDPVAARVRNMLRPNTSRQLVVRKHDSILVYTEQDTGTVLRVDHRNDARVPSSAVVDATGAGDTFVAGLLLVLGAPLLQLSLGTRLGMSFSRAKIQQQGPLSAEATIQAAGELFGARLVDIHRPEVKRGE